MWMHATIMVMVKRRGFTIVELIVVVMIIALLASIAIVSFSAVQARARDSIRKNDVASLAKQIEIYALQNRAWINNGNCGDASDSLNGYVNYDYGVVGNTTIAACLKAYDNTNKQLNDPSGCVTLTDGAATCKQGIRGAYAAYNTTAINSHYFLVAKLETVTDQSAITNNADLDATTKTTITSAGFNYILKVR